MHKRHTTMSSDQTTNDAASLLPPVANLALNEGGVVGGGDVGGSDASAPIASKLPSSSASAGEGRAAGGDGDGDVDGGGGGGGGGGVASEDAASNDNTTAAAGKKKAAPAAPKELTQEQRDKILTQVEFYFSDANLPTDAFLMKKVKSNPEGWVPLGVIVG